MTGGGRGRLIKPFGGLPKLHRSLTKLFETRRSSPELRRRFDSNTVVVGGRGKFVKSVRGLLELRRSLSKLAGARRSLPKLVGVHAELRQGKEAAGVDDYGFNSSSFGQNPDTVNTIVMCRPDVEIATCRDCVRNATIKIKQSCPNDKEAVGWYDPCMIRYSDESIQGKLNVVPVLTISNAFSKDQFNDVLVTLFSSLRENASGGDDRRKYAANAMSGPDLLPIYGFVQCSPDLTSEDCNTCLSGVTNGISKNCTQKVGCFMVTPSCILRYELRPILGPISSVSLTPPPPSNPLSPPPQANGTGKDESTRTTTIIVIVTSIAGFMIVLIFCIFIFLKKKKRKKPRQMVETTDEDSGIDDISNTGCLHYDFEIISEATNGFSNTNKLGQGGFGVVYKGKLQNGKEIAVKRLSLNSRQGEHEFKNEVMLVAKLEHRNLVRLLGFSLEGAERLLIYEFVANSSLDQFIFDPIRRVLLDWDNRFKIISGISKGLLYLHEDSRLRIIHRDMKASNVLLDSEMLPKISDFGMARLFVMDETQGSTSRIVGTYGYMSPEYAMHGHFSVKSDVFSFGVLILEIVTGQKNNRFCINETMEDLLSYAWKCWRKGTAQSLIDPTLTSGSCSIREMMRCIHIGLLCVQENVNERPTMASVVLMLSSSSITIQMPLRPAFFAEEDTSGMIGPLSWSKSTSTRVSQNEASITELDPR